MSSTHRVAQLGLWSTHLAVLSAVVMQAASGDWLPPEVSMSQYANGPLGWTFATALGALGVAIFCLAYLASRVRRSTPVALLLGLSGAGFALAALVPASVDQRTTADAVHQAGATLGLVFLILGACAVAVPLRSETTARSAITFAVLAATSLVLLAAAAYGIEPFGLGAQHAWALYQSIAVVCEVVIVYLLLVMLSRRSAACPASTSP
ncbi:DUF998 domain-containing protein [Epidermidibacterium keratini]|uniref:DUF998 domain-containing protein n=1 Tax=Epidermidibacterium keratini TaxID=1891644 RepID=A0A7M3T525_9ACTN|nr:DUF998 domain-containing protein [Epidermidibacterium keratini]QHB98883.1 DUF998 domain-containing protein [Epidermidibacterium keratini]